MKKVNRLLTAAALMAGAVACSSPAKMAEMAENVKVHATPRFLRLSADRSTPSSP
jgi:outer membrane murein-binding lipoprotein Lpp